MVARVTQPVLSLTPAGAVEIGPIAALVEKDGEGGVVYVNGLATFCFAGGEVGRRLAAVQLAETEIARPSHVAAGFGVTRDTLWRWRRGFAADEVAGLVAGKRGPTGPFKLTVELAARIRELDGRGLSLAAIGARTGVSTATVRVALGRRPGSPGCADAGVAGAATAADGAVDDVVVQPDSMIAGDPGGGPVAGVGGAGAAHAGAGDGPVRAAR